jgi:predicted transcriptional regulator
MKPEFRKAHLNVAGYSMTKLANLLGVSPAAVCMCLDGKIRASRIEAKVSELTEIALWELFPEHYPEPKDAA